MELAVVNSGEDVIKLAPAEALGKLTIVGWLWKSKTCTAQYTPKHANVWARMIDRHLTIPHRFVLMTDQPDANYDPLIKPVPLWEDWRTLKNMTWGESRPQCYVRLKAWSAEAEEILGQRFVSIDLDCLVLNNLDPLFNRDEDFLIYHRFPLRERDKKNTYQASMWMMKAGARAQVWNDFKGQESINAVANQYMGTDQAWIRHKLGPNEPGWTDHDGVYSWPAIQKDKRYKNKPPEDAKIIFFQGMKKPWEFKERGQPQCAQCGALIRIDDPFSVRWRDDGSHTWVAKYWR